MHEVSTQSQDRLTQAKIREQYIQQTNEYFIENRQKLLRVAKNITSEVGTVLSSPEDIVQDTLMSITTNFQSRDFIANPIEGELSNYIVRSITFKAKDALRKKKRENAKNTSPDDQEDALEVTVRSHWTPHSLDSVHLAFERQQEQDAVALAIRSLPTDQALVIGLEIYGGFSISEIQQLLQQFQPNKDVTIGSIKGLKFRARTNLAARLPSILEFGLKSMPAAETGEELLLKLVTQFKEQAVQGKHEESLDELKD